MDDEVLRRLQQAESLRVGADLGDSEVTLAVYGNDLDPDSVTEIVGCPPTHALRKGERHKSYPKRCPVPIGQWFLEAPASLAFEDKIAFVLEKTTSDRKAWSVLGEIHDLQLRCVVYLHSWAEGFSLAPSILQRIAERGWSFGLSMYSAEGDEIIDAFLGKGSEDASLQSETD